MAQETISRAELDADQARQETTFVGQVYKLAADLRAEIHQVQTGLHAEINQLRAEIHQLDRRMMGLERRMFLVAAMATGLIIGAMQLD